MRSNSSAAALVDGQPPVVEVGDLHEGVGAFDDVGEDLALGERFGHAALERLVQLAQAHARASTCDLRRLVTGAEHAGDLAALVADRRIGKGEPGLLVVTLAVHDERQVLAVGRLARHRGVDQRADVGPDLRPDVVEALGPARADAWRRGSRRRGRCRGSRAPRPTRRTSGTATAAAGRRRCAATAARTRAVRAASRTSRGRASARRRCRRQQENRPWEVRLRSKSCDRGTHHFS